MLSTQELADRYAYPEGLDRPWVRTNFVASIDGAAQDRQGLSGNLGGTDDTTIFTVLRSIADVIVVGARTAAIEGYEPVREHEVHAELRTAMKQPPVPPIAVATRHLEVPEALRASGQILITCSNSDPDRRAELATTMDVIVAGDEDIDWTEALHQLGERGLHRVLCEGGPTLHGHLIELDKVDEVCLTIGSIMVAGSALRIAEGKTVSRAMTVADIIEGEGMLAIRWIRKVEGPGPDEPSA